MGRNRDWFGTTGETITWGTFVFPASLGDGIRAIPGVDEVQLVRSFRVLVKNTPVMLVAADIESLGRRARLPAEEGNADEMYRRAAAGEGVLASENLCRLHGCKLGEMLEIPAPTGVLRMPIVGIVRDFSDQQGSLLMDRKVFVRQWNDDAVNIFRIYLKPGTDEASVRHTILEKYGSHNRLFVLTNPDLPAHIIQLTDQCVG